MAAKPDRVPEDKLELYKALIATHPDIELKGGVKLPYTSVNGHMFSSLTKDGRVGLRLSADDRQVLIDEYGAIPFRNYGANIKDHVELPGALLANPEVAAPFLAKALKYTLTLKPK